jgi:hypothetical protein
MFGPQLSAVLPRHRPVAAARTFNTGGAPNVRMDELDLAIPSGIVDSLPEDSDETKMDMQKAVEGWERDLNAALAADDEDEAIAGVVDAVEHFEDRWEEYDDYVVELRAWGQSPIYAMAWRDLVASVVRQIYDHGDLADRINRTRHERIFDDGIRPG